MSNNQFNARVDALRNEMKKQDIAAVIIPQADPHQSEYISNHWQVRRWMSGFTGSAGTLVVTAGEALLWTDSRYFIQSAAQLQGSSIKLMKDGLPDTPSIISYLTGDLLHGATVGIDGLLFSPAEVEKYSKAFSAHDIKLCTTFDVIDKIWLDRPALPQGEVFVHELKYAGQDAASKIEGILKDVNEQGAHSVLVSALDEIAWTLNIRCNDVKYNPVATSFLFVTPGQSTLFIDPVKINNKVAAYLKEVGVATQPYTSIKQFLNDLPKDEKVLVDPTKNSYALFEILGDRVVTGTSPIAMPKGVKNEVQIEGTRKAMERDGAALVKTFMEIERALAAGETVTEIDVAKLATKFRSESPLYYDDSFGTIAGFGPHGAIVHYEATPETNATLSPDNLLLVDSGAQYLDGTTDITRTVSLGKPTDLQRHDFTLVMKGHIALGSIVYPEGTRGAQLDVLARQFLWNEGLSYLHGTGHGVGHFLNVHEGPQSVRLNENPIPLVVGMITSNEPGLYRENIHGVRCENLVLTVPAQSNEFGSFLKFETLTLYPFDLKLFETSIMTDVEIKWVNDYHEEVRRRLMPYLDTEEQRQWLIKNTQPLTR
jgi:Xaa-Pro aminopeptidase